MEKWLQSNNIPKERKLTQAISALTGKANEWWLKENAPNTYKQPVLDWEDLKARMHKEFVEKSRDKAKLACSRDNQGSLQQTQNQLDRQRSVVDLEKQILKALKAMELSQKKGTDLQSCSEPSCSKERPDVPRTEENPPLLCKEESAESNIKEKEEVTDSLQVTEAPPFKEESLSDNTLCEVKSILPYSDFVLTCEELTCVEPVHPSSNDPLSQVQEGVSPEKVQRRLPLLINLAHPKSQVPEPKPFPHDHPNHCKEISTFDVKPILYVLVSTQEEKHFGLEKVKEFCVSKEDFNKMIPTFNNFELEKIFELERFMCSKLNSSLGNYSSFNMSKLFRTQAEFAYLRTISKQLLENVMCVTNPISTSCELDLNDHGFDNYYTKLVHPNMFTNSIRSLFALCSKKGLCDNLCFNARLIYDLVYSFISDHTDITHLSWSEEIITGLRVFLKNTKKRRRKRRSQRREEDKRFKPHDLDQDKHQDISFFMLVKEAPPDAPYKPKPSLNRIGGKCLIIQNSVSINLSFVHAVGSDLRTNPFQEGGDDMILTSTKEMEHEPEIQPAPNWQLLKNTNRKCESRRHGAIQGALIMPRTRELRGVHWRGAEVILGSNRQEELDRALSTIDRRPLDHQPLDHRPLSTIDRRPLDHRPLDHRPSTSRPEITRPATINHSSKVNHSQPRHDVNLVSSTKESKADPEHEPQVKSLEEEKQVATNVWNEPDCPTTRSRTKELKKIIGGMLQATAQLGDDISLGNSKEERPEPEHKPEEDNRQDEELGGIKDALLTPRTKKLKDQWKFAQRLIKAPVQPRAKPSTLVLIQA